MSSENLYKDIHCEKHDHWYGKHLRNCPICIGEEVGRIIKEKLEKGEAINYMELFKKYKYIYEREYRGINK